MLQKTFSCEGKRTHVRPRHQWEDNMKLDLNEIECESAD